MNQSEIAAIVQKQRTYFNSGATLSIDGRIDALKKLRSALKTHEKSLSDALEADLGKSACEGFMCEIGLLTSEISYLIRHIRHFSREKTVKTPLAQFAARSYVKPMPYGVTLIMSPWNYPVLLTLEPLADAIAAGNTAIVKPSAYSPHTSLAIQRLIKSIFDENLVAVVTGGRAENSYLLEEKFDYIFFTGSKSVGRTVLEKAARYLTPVTLELGGKSPCIVDQSADIPLAARRIVFGKYLNCGQTCVAPDYILCHPSVQDELIRYLKMEIQRQYPGDYRTSPTYGKIISSKHFDRICGLIDPDKVVIGGQSCPEKCKIAPTILSEVTWADAVMQEEIFGPVLPILTFESIDAAIQTVNAHPRPLALYIFANDKSFAQRIMNECPFGGGCINDVIIHLATSHMGFGGVGESGMGAYHGKAGFDTFTHYKSIVDKKTWIDLPMRYSPYRPFYERLIRLFLK